ncbi:MAG: YigZ family protein [Eubacteriales bacterium]|nr:YigZ family protein [Eubacteriales bacterium]
MIRYKTVMNEACVENIIERSRFISHVKPIEKKEDADDFIAEIKSRYKDATHNVPAIVIGEKMQIQWASDDGEPQGTAGAPIVQMMVKENLTNIAVVVTRYFGGIKLGTGGLVRAYTGSAKLGIEAAGICEALDMNVLRVNMDYSYLAKLQSLASAKDSKFTIQNLEYSDKITADVVVQPEDRAYLMEMLQNLTSGSLQIISETNEIVKIGI